MKFDERNQFFFISMATVAQFVLLIQIFLAYLVPLDVDVAGNITVKICEVWSEFNFFASWLPWERPPFWIVLTPKAATHYGGYSYKVWWSLMKGIHIFFNPPFLFPWQLRQNLSNWFRFFWLFSFQYMWMLFYSTFINFCSASNLLWSFLCFSIF